MGTNRWWITVVDVRYTLVMVQSVRLDDVDRQLIHALHVGPRTPLSRISEILDVSDRTLARRYRQMRSDATVRVVGVPNITSVAYTTWVVQSQCAPGAATSVATVLSRRRDTSWVSVASAGTVVVYVIGIPSSRATVLPQVPGITATRAHCLLDTVVGPCGWAAATDALEQWQIDELTDAMAVPDQSDRFNLTPADQLLISTLAGDGRTGYAGLADISGWSESTVRRRITDLCRVGALHFEVEYDPILFGGRAEAFLWLQVRPADMQTVAAALNTFPEVVGALTTTGPTNMVVVVVGADVAAIHDCVTHRIGILPGVSTAEITLISARATRCGSLQE